MFAAASVVCPASCHAIPLDGLDLQEAASAAKAAEDKAAQDELERQKRIKDSFDAQMPDEISQKVQAALQKEMVSYYRNVICHT